MGKTLWKDTLAHYYDLAHKHQFNELFGHLEIGRHSPTQLANTFHVLALNFAGIASHSIDHFKTSLNNMLNTSMDHVKKVYNLSFELNELDALDTFQRLVDELEIKKEKLFVFIDEHDASVNRALSYNLLVPELWMGDESVFKGMEKAYAEFYDKLEMACDKDVARCFVTGVTPLALNESWFASATHITHDPRFASLYGFTEADVRNGLARLPEVVQREVIERIIKSWRHEHNGYRFIPAQEVALFNPTRVIHALGELERALRCNPPPSTLRPEQAANFLLNRSQRDINSMPAEATLAAIVPCPDALMVIAQALSSDDAELEVQGGIADQFRLSHMHELTSDRRQLLSFMFYTGALTDAPPRPGSAAVETKRSLIIPNNEARKEFAHKLKHMLHVNDAELQLLREAIVVMVEEREVEPLRHALSQFLLHGIYQRNAHGVKEHPFAQAVYGALSFARRPGDKRKDFMMDHVADSHTPYPALNVIYINQHVSTSPQPQQFYSFTLQNVEVKDLVLGQGVQSLKEQVEISCDIHDMSDSAVLGLAFVEGQHNKTVQTVLEEAIQDAQGICMLAPQAEVSKANVHCWVLVQVGMARIVCRKV